MALTDKIMFYKRDESGRGRERPKNNNIINSFF